MTSKYLLYFDDSGNRNPDHMPTPPRTDKMDYFALGGILVKEEDVTVEFKIIDRHSNYAMPPTCPACRHAGRHPARGKAACIKALRAARPRPTCFTCKACRRGGESINNYWLSYILRRTMP